MRHTRVMSAEKDEHIGGNAATPRPRWHRALLLAATVTLGVLTVAVAGVALVDSMSGGAMQLMLGPLLSEQIIGVATILAFTMTASMLCVVPAPSGWLVPVVIARALSFGAALVAFLWGVFMLPAAVTPLLVAGCESGYIVKERSLLLLSSITVFEKNGLLIIPVTHTSADDGYQPFAAGTYDAWVTGNRIDGWFAMEPGPARPVETFTLPSLRSPDCRN